MKHIHTNAVKKYLGNDAKKIVLLILLVVVAYYVNTHIIRLAIVGGESMYPTVMDKDILLINQMNYHPSRGDVVLVDISGSPLLGQYIVKRIIAVGGDTVNLDYKSDSVFVNGERISEPYLNLCQDDPMIAPDSPSDVTYQVPSGTVFVMGDNRNNSLDSRSDMLGMIKEADIVGEVCMHLSLQQYFS